MIYKKKTGKTKMFNKQYETISLIGALLLGKDPTLNVLSMPSEIPLEKYFLYKKVSVAVSFVVRDGNQCLLSTIRIEFLSGLNLL